MEMDYDHENFAIELGDLRGAGRVPSESYAARRWANGEEKLADISPPLSRLPLLEAAVEGPTAKGLL